MIFLKTSDNILSCSQLLLADIWRDKEHALLKALKEESDMEVAREIMLRTVQDESERGRLQEIFIAGCPIKLKLMILCVGLKP